MQIKLKIKKLKDVNLPKYEHRGDAGLDLFAAETVVIGVGQKIAVPTGIAMEIPEGYVGLVWDKSGLAIKQGLKTLGGVIDSGYRGEVMVGIINLGTTDYTIEKNHKVAQMLIQKKEWVDVVEVSELSDSERGVGGFGSTGK